MKVILRLSVDGSDPRFREADLPEAIIRKGAFVYLPLEGPEEAGNRCLIEEIEWDSGDLCLLLELEVDGVRDYDQEDFDEICARMKREWESLEQYLDKFSLRQTPLWLQVPEEDRYIPAKRLDASLIEAAHLASKYGSPHYVYQSDRGDGYYLVTHTIPAARSYFTVTYTQ